MPSDTKTIKEEDQKYKRSNEQEKSNPGARSMNSSNKKEQGAENSNPGARYTIIL